MYLYGWMNEWMDANKFMICTNERFARTYETNSMKNHNENIDI